MRGSAMAALSVAARSRFCACAKINSFGYADFPSKKDPRQIDPKLSFLVSGFSSLWSLWFLAFSGLSGRSGLSGLSGPSGFWSVVKKVKRLKS